MRRAFSLGVWAASALITLPSLGAQEIPRPDYFTYLPRGLSLPVAAQPATGAFQLYGDPAGANYVAAHGIQKLFGWFGGRSDA